MGLFCNQTRKCSVELYSLANFPSHHRPCCLRIMLGLLRSVQLSSCCSSCTFAAARIFCGRSITTLRLEAVTYVLPDIMSICSSVLQVVSSHCPKILAWLVPCFLIANQDLFINFIFRLKQAFDNRLSWTPSCGTLDNQMPWLPVTWFAVVNQLIASSNDLVHFILYFYARG